MNLKNIVLLILSSPIIFVPTIAKATPSNACPITKSVYRDGDGNGYQLVFGPPPSKSVYPATASIKHPQYGLIYQFTVSQSSGYGSVSLIEPKTRSKHQTALWITFFDQSLKSATPLWLGEAKQAPEYAVIAELGSYDYYQSRGQTGESSRPLLRDPMWVFDRCQ